MATNVTPLATPKGGFPLRVSVAVRGGDTHTVLFPASGVRDITRTNLCPNPKFGTLALTNWTNAGNATFEALGVLPKPLPINQPITTALHAISDGNGDRTTCASLVTTSGLDYTCSMYFYIVSNTATSLRLIVRDDAGATVTTSDFTPPLATWQRLAVTFNAPSSGVNYKFDLQQNGAGGIEYYATANLMAQASQANPYFDGDTHADTAWTGAANLSTSTDSMARVVDDLKRTYALNSADAVVPAVT